MMIGSRVACVLAIALVFAFSARAAEKDRDDSLVLHYTFDKDTGQTAKDQSGHGNDLKLFKTQYVDDSEGRKGVLRFAGDETSYALTGKAESLAINGDMSYEMWVRLYKPIRNSSAFIFGSDYPLDFYFVVNSYCTLVLGYCGGLGDAEAREQTVLPVERGILGLEWSHIAVVVEYPRCRFYYNGRLVKDAYMPFAGISNLKSPAKRFGGGKNGGCPMDLDEFRLYRRALTPQEVLAHAGGKEMAPIATRELAVEPDWYKSTLTLRLVCKGKDFAALQAELLLQDLNGKSIASQKVAISEAFKGANRYVASATFPLADLKGKSIKADARVAGAAKPVVSNFPRTVALEKPEWIENRDGYSDQVPAPWTALKAKAAADGSVEVDVWDRKHVFGASPFVQKIQSGGMDLLAAPVTLSGREDAQPIAWKDQQTKLLNSSDLSASIEQASHAGALALRVKTDIEYDGYAILDCELEARRDVSLANLMLQIPLHSQYATLCYGDRVLPKNPEIPISQWYSGAVTQDLSFGFGPNIWLGNEQRGLTWQAESDQDWHYADPQKAIEILPRGEKTLFQAHLIDAPRKLTKGQKLHYKFALLATPIKPRLRDAWSMRIARSEPYGADLNLPDRMTANKPALQYLADAGLRNLFINVSDVWPYPMPIHEAHIQALHRAVDAAHRYGLKIYCYVIHQRFPVVVPEFDIYGLNMSCRPMTQYIFGANPPHSARPAPLTIDYGADSQGCTFMCTKSQALQDAFIHSLAQRLKEFGENGAYLDGTVHIVPCTNADHGCGYRAEDGTIHPTYPVFAVRQFMKRIYTLVKQADPNGIVDVHCSWGYNPAGLAYADVLWNGEQWHHLRKTGSKYIPGDLTLEMFRTEFMGYQLGVPAESLCYRLGSPMKVAAISLLHDVSPRMSTSGGAIAVESQDEENAKSKSSNNYYEIVPRLWKLRDEFGADQAEKLFYWNNKDYVTVSPDKCYATLLKHPQNGVLALVSNLAPEAQTVSVQFNLEKLGLRGKKLTVVNPLDGKTVEMSADGTLSLPLASVQWQYVWLRPG